MTKKKAKKKRTQVTCYCPVYAFPHRIFGGRCTVNKWTAAYWLMSFGYLACTNCNCLVEGECEVVTGKERARYCNALQDFCHYEGIRLPTKAK